MSSCVNGQQGSAQGRTPVRSYRRRERSSHIGRSRHTQGTDPTAALRWRDGTRADGTRGGRWSRPRRRPLTPSSVAGRMLGDAAMRGEEFAPAVPQQVSGLPINTLTTLLEEAEAARLIHSPTTSRIGSGSPMPSCARCSMPVSRQRPPSAPRPSRPSTGAHRRYRRDEASWRCPTPSPRSPWITSAVPRKARSRCWPSRRPLCSRTGHQTRWARRRRRAAPRARRGRHACR